MAGPLGKKVAIPNTFNPEILFPISREEQRKDKNLVLSSGKDIWNIHELFWLDKFNYSNHNQLSIHIPAESKFTVESKSLKLFINSFIFKRFKTLQDVHITLKKHLEDLLQTDVEINEIYSNLNIKSEKIVIESDFNNALKTSYNQDITRFSGFRSLCPVTSQPDVADIYIDGKIHPDEKTNIAKYLGTFFDKECFHELCVEYILSDLLNAGYEIKSVEGYFERRGGIAIIPIRTAK